MRLIILILFSLSAFAFEALENLSKDIVIHNATYFHTKKILSPHDVYQYMNNHSLTKIEGKGKFLGQSADTYWFSFKVSTTGNTKLFLDTKEVFIGNSQDLFIFNEKGRLIKSYANGQIVPIEQRAVKTHAARFFLEENSKNMTYILRLRSHFPMQASFAMGEMMDIEKSWGNSLWIYTISVYILIAFLFYNLMLFVMSREKFFLYYIFYIGGFLMAFVARWPYNIEFISLSSSTLYIFYNIGTGIGIMGLVFFTIELLGISTQNKQIKYFITLSLFVILLNIMHTYNKSDILNVVWLVFASIDVLWLISIVIKNYLDGNKIALLYLISTGIGSSVMVGGIFLTLYLQMWSYNEWSLNISILSIVWDAITLSLVLAYRLKVTQNEKDLAVKTIAQKERFTIMGETIGNVAHQWKQPLGQLSSINSSMEFMIMTQNNPDIQKLKASLSESNQTITRMSQTIDTFQRFFQKNNFSNFELNSCINEVLIFMHGELKDISVSFNSNEEINIEGEKNEFIEVLLIFIRNAKDALIETHPLNPNIHIEIMVIGDNVVVSMSDNGGGIKSDNLQTIFEPYVSSKGLNGMGIGLFTAKSIVEKMGGTIKAENTNDGAKFIIVLHIMP